jgi:hypothetical protein
VQTLHGRGFFVRRRPIAATRCSRHGRGVLVRIRLGPIVLELEAGQNREIRSDDQEMAQIGSLQMTLQTRAIARLCRIAPAGHTGCCSFDLAADEARIVMTPLVAKE